jgi:very-short-patch-repair endonuclease
MVRKIKPLAKIAQARNLRSHTTLAERKLWSCLQNKQLNGIKFRRQHPIGPYIVDFCAISHQLVIELDGSQHLEQEPSDIQRTSFLEDQGFQVLRFWNNQVFNDLNGVIRSIEDALTSLS